jgi:hypothetical protein
MFAVAVSAVFVAIYAPVPCKKVKE